LSILGDVKSGEVGYAAICAIFHHLGIFHLNHFVLLYYA
jgi:hypothetical protein